MKDNLIVTEGDYRLVFYPQGGFSYQSRNPEPHGWGECNDETITSPYLIAAVRLYRPEFPEECI
jgi:hypothetical protein